MSLKLTLNRKGVKELLNSEEVANYCTTIANQVRQRAGEGYAVAEPHHTGQRVIVNVYPATKKAAHDNYEHDTLAGAVGQ